MNNIQRVLLIIVIATITWAGVYDWLNGRQQETAIISVVITAVVGFFLFKTKK